MILYPDGKKEMTIKEYIEYQTHMETKARVEKKPFVYYHMLPKYAKENMNYEIVYVE